MKKAVWDRSTNIDSTAPVSKRDGVVRGAGQLVQTLFPVLLVTITLLLLVETLFEGSVVSYIDVDLLLRIVVGTGVVSVILSSPRTGIDKQERLTESRIAMIVCTGVGGAAIVWYKTQELGLLSYAISVVSGGLILLLLISAYHGEEVREIEQENQSN